MNLISLQSVGLWFLILSLLTASNFLDLVLGLDYFLKNLLVCSLFRIGEQIITKIWCCITKKGIINHGRMCQNIVPGNSSVQSPFQKRGILVSRGLPCSHDNNICRHIITRMGISMSHHYVCCTWCDNSLSICLGSNSKLIIFDTKVHVLSSADLVPCT